jgi:metal-responsive CopG/Arc/MetJ family transcriptional regulator
MPDDPRRTKIEVNLPRALLERVRSLASKREGTPGSIVRDALDMYFAKQTNALEAREPS